VKSAGKEADVLYRSPLGKMGLTPETVSLGKIVLEPFGFVVVKAK
jgi:hypothetical protein